VAALRQKQALLQVALPEAAVQVAAGGYMSFALSEAGRLYAWGSNGNGEQGSGQWAWSGYRANMVSQISDGRVAQVHIPPRLHSSRLAGSLPPKRPASSGCWWHWLHCVVP
jgi:hypothetical protein